MFDFVMSPKMFNYIFMSMYLMAAIRWACCKHWADSLYWLFALGITATVTFWYQR